MKHIFFTCQYKFFTTALLLLTSVIAHASISIESSVSQGCAPLKVAFRSIGSSSVASLKWDFGNGDKSSLETPTILYDQPGEYNVTVVVEYTNGQTDTLFYENFIKVFKKPTASFEIEKSIVCLHDTVSFLNNSVGGDNFLWDFGDGNNAKSKKGNQSYIYNQPGTYTVTLIAYNEAGCSGNLIMQGAINVKPGPNTDFTSNITEACLNENSFTFSAAINTPQQSWDFGDGNTSQSRNPTHQYAEAGVYNVRLTSTGANGCSLTHQKANYIEVLQSPEVNPQLSDSVLCQGDTIQFMGLAATDKNIRELEWLLSDGFKTSEQTFSHVFSSPGKHGFTITAVSKNGCITEQGFNDYITIHGSPTPEVAISQDFGCAPLTTTLTSKNLGQTNQLWDFGDGIEAGVDSLVKTFDKEASISFKAYNEYPNGCTSLLTLDSAITVHKPNLAIIVSDSIGCVPFSTQFQLKDTSLTNIQWDFGNGNNSTLPSSTVDYQTAGLFDVGVMATDKYGCKGSMVQRQFIKVADTLAGYIPSQEITLCAFDQISFVGSKVGNHFWRWDFGDGETSNAINPTHKYTESGTYSVSLNTVNSNGCETTIQDYYIINVINIQADFEYLLNIGSCKAVNVQFENSSKNADSYIWDFGNGVTSSISDPKVSFVEEEQYTITLHAIGQTGCSSTKTVVINMPSLICNDDGGEMDEEGDEGDQGDDVDTILRPSPPSTSLVACTAPFKVQLRNPHPTVLNCQWHFGDGQSSTDTNPEHTYEMPGTYSVDLFLFQDDGSIDSLKAFKQVVVNDIDVAFSVTQRASCDGSEVDFFGDNSGSISWKWDFGNGKTSEARDTTLIYDKEKIYNIRHTATDNNGCSGQLIQSLVTGNPFPSFSHSSIICKDETLSISHNLAGFSEYLWDFGDGSSSEDLFPSHTFSKSGTFEIRLKVVAEDGCTKHFELPNKVTVFYPTPKFEVTSDRSGCDSLLVSFKNLSAGAQEWYWDFGNGTFSTEKNPTVLYQEKGIYDVSLTASQNGCSGQLVFQEAIEVGGVQSQFSVTQDKTCLPITASFDDQSEEATEWLWNFGDGSTSKERNPVHTFNKKTGGKVVLTVKNASGCSSKTTKDKMISFIKQDIKSDVTKGCLPLQCSFTSTNEDATSWFWDFGDGNSSSEQAPTHTYHETGQYDVSLIAKLPSGCYDTLQKQAFITVGELDVDYRAILPESNCIPTFVEFESMASPAISYHWEFGDGTTSSEKNPSHMFISPGSFDVKLKIENKLGCVDSLTYDDIIKTKGPQPDFSFSDSTVCLPNKVGFKDNSKNAIALEWFFGDGEISSAQNPSHLYHSSGDYTVSLLATGPSGCKNVKTSIPIKASNTPKLGFDFDMASNCLPAKVHIANNSENVANTEFLWDFGDGITSEQYEPEVTLFKAGTFDIDLSATNSDGCSAKMIKEKAIVVKDTFNIKELNVLTLTVMSNTETKMVWKPYDRNNFDYSVIYRKRLQDTVFQVLDTLFDASTSFYTDQSINTNKGSCAYKIQTQLSCTPLGGFNQLTTYKSIHLTATALDHTIKLNWTPYQGHGFDHYLISRRQKGKTWDKVSEVPSNTTIYEDIEHLCPTEYEYKITAYNLAGLGHQSESNLSTATPTKNIFKEQEVEIVKSSVLGENMIFTEWKKPVIGEDKVDYYEVFRSENSLNFTHIANIPKGVESFMDENVKTGESRYTYKIQVANTCKVPSKTSNLGTPILLQKRTQDYINELFWTPYLGWEDGVLEYQLQVLDENGEWKTVKMLPSSGRKAVVDLND